MVPKQKRRTQGFTLIELLVVIAIIGILSAVVLASLNTARSKGSDAAIKSDLHTIQTQAELYYTSNPSTGYGVQSFQHTTPTLCSAGIFADTSVSNALKAAYSTSGATSGNIACVAATTNYAVGVKLVANSASGEWWCIDSSGRSTVESGSGAYAFPSTGFASGNTCP